MAFVSKIKFSLKYFSNRSVSLALRCTSVRGLTCGTNYQSRRLAFSGYNELDLCRLIMDRKIGWSRLSKFTTDTFGDEISAVMTNKNGMEHFAVAGALTPNCCMKISKRDLSCQREVGDGSELGGVTDDSDMSNLNYVRIVRDEDIKSKETLWNLYMRWRNDYKVPRNPDEIQKRFIIFKKNVRRIHERNKRNCNLDDPDTCVLGLNQFSDMTFEEAALQCCGCSMY